MIYLDYAANTPVDEEVLNTFVEATKKYIANPNSSHPLGQLAKNEIDKCNEKIARIFNCSSEGIIYTSGASESNNLVIKGIAKKNKNKGNHIIISSVEHSSIIAPCNYLAQEGYDISVIPLDENGLVDLNILKKEINDNTILVSICTVDSELGTIQPIDKIADIVHEYKNCLFHTDATQAIGKIDVDYSKCDFITFTPHKFYGLNGFGALINRHNNTLIPLIHGGKSTTIYRSGTPVTANVIALNKALELAISKLKERTKIIQELKEYILNELTKKEYIHINSPKHSIPNTINISLINKNTKEILENLKKDNICISTGSACSLESAPSSSVLAITKDEQLAKNSLRITISHLTTKKEITYFLEKLFTFCEK